MCVLQGLHLVLWQEAQENTFFAALTVTGSQVLFATTRASGDPSVVFQVSFSLDGCGCQCKGLKTATTHARKHIMSQGGF